MVNRRQALFSPNWRWNTSPFWRQLDMGNRIKELRTGLGLTQDQVADVAGTTAQQIARLEAGERRLTDVWMRKIAPALGVPTAALLSDEGPNIPRLPQEPKKIRLRADEIDLIRFWRSLDVAEKRFIAAVARDKGLEILIDKPETRSA